MGDYSIRLLLTGIVHDVKRVRYVSFCNNKLGTWVMLRTRRDREREGQEANGKGGMYLVDTSAPVYFV